jgi:hypothetical protein
MAHARHSPNACIALAIARGSAESDQRCRRTLEFGNYSSMTKIDRYLLFLYTRVFLICFLTLSGLLVVVQVFTLMR